MSVDLSTTYLGLTLRSPLVVGAAAPLTEDLDQLKSIVTEQPLVAAQVIKSWVGDT